MTIQQPQSDQFRPTGDELGAAWASRLNQTIIENIALEKLTAQMKTQIEVQAQNGVRLQAHIQDLEAKVAEFTQQEYDFVDHIQALELELDVMKTATPDRVPATGTAETSEAGIAEFAQQQHTLSEEAAEIAAEGSAIIKEKAAPIEAA